LFPVFHDESVVFVDEDDAQFIKAFVHFWNFQAGGCAEDGGVRDTLGPLSYVDNTEENC
jgi:hypothetical protein